MVDAHEPFELALKVEASDIDRLHHVNNVVYLRWVQEATEAHWAAAASMAVQRDLFWVVVRHEIDYRRPALAGDGIIARTWVGKARSPRAFERHTEILREKDRAVLARATTLWCPMDAHTGRPARVSDEVRAAFTVD
ncbi:MAG TPA: thioesterase family protein [Holophaga sp.]|nr:thioesterase family protein [Holophaga sp.]